MLSVWDTRFLQLAELIASWSKDPSTKVGAVLVGKDRREIAVGYNGFPARVPDTPEWLADRETKRLLIQHAERNALDNALFNLAGATLYCTMYPCNECAKSIVARGVNRVVTRPPMPREPWMSSSSAAAKIMSIAGLQVDVVDGGVS